MSEGLRNQLPMVLVVCLAGIATGAFALVQVANAAASLDVGSFSLYIILIPSVLMVICPFIIMLSSHEIGRQLYLVVVGVCFVSGIVSMVVTSAWMSDASIASQLLANSPDGTQITPPVQSIVVVIRNLAAYIVAPTVGSILGAWVGSRIHPMKAAGKGRRR